VAREINRLTTRKIQAITEAGWYLDGEGLYLAVEPSGSKRWVLRYRLPGRRREMGLGSFAVVPLAKARELAAAARAQIQEGIDPIAEKTKAKAEPAAPVLFSDVAVTYMTDREKTWRNAAHRKQWRTSLEVDGAKIWNMPVAAVGTDDVLAVLRPIWHEKAESARRLRGRMFSMIFQDPMTSLNPIITIGKQITSIILKHQDCTEAEARQRALELMHKVGIPNAAARFDDYPFQYSGGMRQRIVIAIALSCQPKILICDEPTTALDVTIQAQILQLIKDLQKEFQYTIVFITHDLGVVANVADRVAVLYAGQIIELGTVREVFYDPKHPYTWALLSSLPQLAQKNTKLYSITGTPPSLYNQIVGDAFAPRNPYCLKIDTLEEPPLFQVSETHFAKTWLLDPRSPKIEKPEGIQNIHEKLMEEFNIEGGADRESRKSK